MSGAFCLTRGVRADAGGAGVFVMLRSCSFARYHRADGTPSSPLNSERGLPSSAEAGQYRPCMEGMEEGSAAGTSLATTTARNPPTASCDVACSECVLAEAGTADRRFGSAVEGSGIEGLKAVGVVPLYAKPALAAGRAIGRASAAQ